MIHPAVWRRKFWMLFGAVLLRVVRISTIKLFAQSGRIRASTQGDVEQFKIRIYAELFRQFHCCSCPLWELELLHQETVYIVYYIMPLLLWFVVEIKINRQVQEIELFAEQPLIYILWAIYSCIWSVVCANKLYFVGQNAVYQNSKHLIEKAVRLNSQHLFTAIDKWELLHPVGLVHFTPWNVRWATVGAESISRAISISPTTI